MPKPRQQTGQPLSGAARRLQPTARPIGVGIGATPPATGESPFFQLASVLGQWNQRLRNASIRTQERLSEEGMVQGALIAEKLGARATMDDLHAELKFRGVKQRKLPWYRIGVEMRYGDIYARDILNRLYRERFPDALGLNPKTSPDDVIKQVQQEAYEGLLIKSKNVDIGFLAAQDELTRKFLRRVDEENIKQSASLNTRTRRDKFSFYIGEWAVSDDPRKDENLSDQIRGFFEGHTLDGKGIYSNEIPKNQLISVFVKDAMMQLTPMLYPRGGATVESNDEVFELLDIVSDVVINGRRVGGTSVWREQLGIFYSRVNNNTGGEDEGLDAEDKREADREEGVAAAEKAFIEDGRPHNEAQIRMEMEKRELANPDLTPQNQTAYHKARYQYMIREDNPETVSGIQKALSEGDDNIAEILIKQGVENGNLTHGSAKNFTRGVDQIRAGTKWIGPGEKVTLINEHFFEVAPGGRRGVPQLSHTGEQFKALLKNWDSYDLKTRRVFEERFGQSYELYTLTEIKHMYAIGKTDEDIKSQLSQIKERAVIKAFTDLDAYAEAKAQKIVDDRLRAFRADYGGSKDTGIKLRKKLLDKYRLWGAARYYKDFDPLDPNAPEYAPTLQSFADRFLQVRGAALPSGIELEEAGKFRDFYVLIKSIGGLTHKEFMEGITNEGVYFTRSDVNWKNTPLFENASKLLKAWNNGITTSEFNDIYLQIWDAGKTPDMTPGIFMSHQFSAIAQRTALSNEIRNRYYPGQREPQYIITKSARGPWSMFYNRQTGETYSDLDEVIETHFKKEIELRQEIRRRLVAVKTPDVKTPDVETPDVSTDGGDKIEPLTADEMVAADREEKARKLAEDREERARRMAEGRAERE